MDESGALNWICGRSVRFSCCRPDVLSAVIFRRWTANVYFSVFSDGGSARCSIDIVARSSYRLLTRTNACPKLFVNHGRQMRLFNIVLLILCSVSVRPFMTVNDCVRSRMASTKSHMHCAHCILPIFAECSRDILVIILSSKMFEIWVVVATGCG